MSQLTQHFFVGLGAQIYMDRDRIGAELDCLFDAANKLLCVRVGAKRCSAGKMNNQPDVFAGASVTGPNDSFVHQNGISTTGHDAADGFPHVRKTFNRPYRNPVVHRDNYSPVGIAVDDSFESDLFAYHSENLQNINLL
jgi:hypothetical protein